MKTKLLLAAMVCTTATALAVQPKQGQLDNVTRLTSDQKVRYENPVWAPDGKQIAFTAEGYTGLYVMDTATKQVKQLSADPGVGYMFQWDAASSEILVRDTRYVSTPRGVERVHAAFVLGTDGKKVRLTDDDPDLKPAAWRYGNTGAKTFVASAPKRKVNLGTVTPAALGVKTATAPAANTGISFEEDFENLYILDQAGNRRVLVAGPAFNAQLSPDGTKVVYNLMDDIYVTNLQGTVKTKVGTGFRPQWVGDTQLVYERTTDNGHIYTAGELYLYTLGTRQEKALTQTSGLIEMFPSVSPDGKKIVFTSNTDGQIYIADLK